MALLVTEAGAQGAFFSIVPRVSLAETFTDNVFLASVGRKSELTSEINPGIRITSNGGQIKGSFDYSLRETFYANNSSGRRSQNALNTFGQIVVVDNKAFVDFSGTISQQTISAFGTLSAGNSVINPNLTESRTFYVSPYLRGRLASFADYEIRYGLTTSRNQSALAPGVSTNVASIKLNGQTTSARLAWSVDASRQNTGYDAGRTSEADSLKASLIYTFNPQLNVSVTGGQEANNYATVGKESSSVSGFAVKWIPSDITQLSASRLKRSFGESHSVSVDHRTALTALRFSDVKDVSATPSQIGSVGLGSTYDLYFAQFASIEPDPTRRAALVSNFLQANGINPSTSVVSSFLTSAISLQRRQDFSFALLGLRDTVTFFANRSEGSRLDAIAAVNDDLSNSASVRQRGLSVSYAHRLTPEASINVLASAQKASDSLGLQNTTSKSINVSVSTRLGTRSTGLLSARRVVFESAASPYTENAITGTLNVQF